MDSPTIISPFTNIPPTPFNQPSPHQTILFINLEAKLYLFIPKNQLYIPFKDKGPQTFILSSIQQRVSQSRPERLTSCLERLSITPKEALITYTASPVLHRLHRETSSRHISHSFQSNQTAYQRLHRETSFTP